MDVLKNWEQDDIRAIFEKYDTDNSGDLDCGEFELALKELTSNTALPK